MLARLPQVTSRHCDDDGCDIVVLIHAYLGLDSELHHGVLREQRLVRMRRF